MTEEQFIEFIKYFQEHDGKYSFGVANITDNRISNLHRIPPKKLSYKILGSNKGSLCIVFDSSILLNLCINQNDLNKVKLNVSKYRDLIKKGRDVLGNVEYINQLESGFNEFLQAWNDFFNTFQNKISK